MSRPPPGVIPIVREAARVVLLDERDRLLLFRWEVPPGLDGGRNRSARASVWITPGGGLDEGETHAQAALRELWEETGLSAVGLGPCAWERRHVFRFKERWIEQHELYFVARAPAMVLDRTNWTTDEQEWIREHRWWGVEEMAAAQTERFAPRALAALVAQGLREGFPTSPARVED